MTNRCNLAIKKYISCKWLSGEVPKIIFARKTGGQIIILDETISMDKRRGYTMGEQRGGAVRIRTGGTHAGNYRTEMCRAAAKSS